METNILTPKKLFQKDIHYTIPDFQRPYVWTQEDQWEPLWDDVRNTADSYLEKMDQCDDKLEAQQNTLPHFLGAIVIQQVPTPVKDIEQREVIDGQQRITTLQLLLDAVQLVCAELKFEIEAKRLSKLVINDEDLLTDENQKFKLWPTRNDRKAFKHAMDNGLANDDFEDSLIVQAHEFFQLQAREWLKSGLHTPAQRIEGLETAVTGMLQMVIIDLSSNDDPHVIFETLNARGTPLLESELVKNYVMSKVEQERQSNIWGNLGDQWWSKETRQGRLYRPRIDMLLNYWLAMRIRDEVSPAKVFNTFKTLADEDGRSIDEVMSEVKRDLGNYHRYEQEENRSPEEDIFHYRTGVMQAGVITPALFLILPMPYEERVKSLQTLESFLIRRMLCRRTTKDYNKLIFELVGQLRNSGPDGANSVIVEFFKGQTADSREWPDDKDLEHALITLPLYRLLSRGRLRLVLEGIEGKLRSLSMAEQPDTPKSLTIEHVMPQSWHANWPLPEDVEKQEATDERNRLIHTIGNLTLVSGRLNPALSNAPWEHKRKTLTEHSTLFLNKELQKESQNRVWDEQFIQSRSKRMAALATEVWPGPHSPIWNT